jgi:prepilin-type N-terminal cleavage/methylation domain-containing protein
MYRKGFTLVELAIVLIIIGVMTAGGIIGVNSAINSSRFNSTKNQIEGVLKSIAEYSATGQRIPSDDIEIQTFLSPFTDNFGNNIIYIPASELINTGSICNTENTSLTVRQCNDANCLTSSNYNDIAFFVSSRSINGASEINIGANDIDLFDNSINPDYDDITGFLTLSSLKAFAGCEGSTIQIIEDKLPTAYILSEYDTRIHVKGGTPPYYWCMESDEPAVKINMKLGSNSILDINGCSTFPSDYVQVSNTSISLDSDDNDLPLGTTIPNSSLLHVYLRDSSGAATSKKFPLIVENLKVADSSEEELQNVLNGDIAGFEDFMDGNSPGNGAGSADYLINGADTELTLHVNYISDHSGGNHEPDPVAAFYGCGSDEFPSLDCAKFGNNGALAFYYTTEYYSKKYETRPQGFTFAVIRSTYETKDGTTFDTSKETGANKTGLGYGGDCENFQVGIKGGNSFAVQYDLFETSCDKDKSSDHMGIVSYSSVHDYNGTYTNGHYNNDHTYSSYGNVMHYTHDYGWAKVSDEGFTSSGVRGGATYYNNSEIVIPNNRDSNDSLLFGTRVEAISGCNADGTVCDKKEGSENHTCVFVWKEMRTDMAENPAMQTDMMDVSVHHAFDKIFNNTDYPSSIGSPLMKYCYVDDTTTRNTMDYIRFGFTASAWDKGGNDFFIRFTEFLGKISEY